MSIVQPFLKAEERAPAESMGPSETSQHAIRRSTRLPLEVPVHVVSVDAAFPFSEPCNTTLVNAHGCGLISPRPLTLGTRVRIEITSARRHTLARVTEVVPLGGDPETWLIGLELEVPGNFWGIEFAPADWKVEETIVAQPAGEETSKPAKAGRWRLSDISLGACYLESATPFPIDTPVLISFRTPDKEFLLDGVVRLSHLQVGMGVVFIRQEGQRRGVEELIGQLTTNREVPRIFVGRKEGDQAAHGVPEPPFDPEAPDSLLELVLTGSAMPLPQFQYVLRQQRLGKRRDPRIDIEMAVLLTGVDVRGRPLDQRVTTVNVSEGGALLKGIHGELKAGDKVSLARAGKVEEFRVAWVVDDVAMGASIGVVAANPDSSFWNAILEAAGQSAPQSAKAGGNDGSE